MWLVVVACCFATINVPAGAAPLGDKAFSAEAEDAPDGGEVTARWWETGGGGDASEGTDEGGADDDGGARLEPVEICVQTTVDAGVARQLTGRTDIPDGS